MLEQVICHSEVIENRGLYIIPMILANIPEEKNGDFLMQHFGNLQNVQ